MRLAETARAPRLTAIAVSLGLGLSLLLAYLGKVVCVDGEAGFWRLTRYCYSDVYVLWGLRGFDVGTVPYREIAPGAAPLEYPPGLAFPAWIIGLITDTRRGFFDLHALTFALAAVAAVLLCAVALRATSGKVDATRLFGIALSPGLVLFGMQNWDLWPVAFVAGGLAAAAIGRPRLAGVLLGAGAAIKWWPAVIVVVLLAGPWSPGGGHARPPGVDGADRPVGWSLRALAGRLEGLGIDLRPAVAAAATWVALQLPGILVSPSGWWRAIEVHLARRPNFDSTAAALAELGQRLAPGPFWGDPFARGWTVLSFLVLIGGAAYVLERLRAGTLTPANAALALVGIFLLTSKVFSPQFVLWLLPLAVVANVSWTPVLAVEAANAAVWLLYGPWMGHLDESPAYDGFLHAAQGMSVVRSLTLAWLVVAALSTGLSEARRRRPAAAPALR